MNEKQPLWEPRSEQIDKSNMMKFMKFVNGKYGCSFTNYHDLYEWSIDEIENFWLSVLEYSGIKYKGRIETILRYPEDRTLGIHKRKAFVTPGVKWFEGIKMNFAENLLLFRDDSLAIIEYNEKSETANLSYSELYQKVALARQGLVNLGVKEGDRVAALISNISEAIIGMLATTSIGAIWSSCSPDFGFQGVLDRFEQIKPKVLIAVDGYNYNGKTFSSVETIKKLINKLEHTNNYVIVQKTGMNTDELQYGDKIIKTWEELLDNESVEIDFEQTEFDHPIYIMYSSGTTGKPKCIVHGAGGTLIQHYKELALHTNLTKDDRIFFFTTCGWMMWNWLVSSLNIGATILLYDGSPTHPLKDSLWKTAQDYKISIFGTSPKFLTMCEKAELKPQEKYDLSELKTILSTGAPLTENNYQYVYDNIKSDVQLSSISGGTDIISCFMLGNPILPVYREEIQRAGLGMKIESWDDKGKAHIGRKGELVCSKVFPSMPVYFWEDEDDELYMNAYFNYFPGVWRHGDYIEITERGGVIVYGRSDATLNPGGVRIGTAEIYRIVEANESISDSIIVAKKIEGEDVIILFVVLQNGIRLSEDLIIQIKNDIRSNLTARHVPKFIRQIEEVPVTINGKKVEIAVSKILNGESIANRDALANPESLSQFEGLIF